MPGAGGKVSMAALLAVVALLAAGAAVVLALRAQRAADEARATSRRLEASHILDSAWVLMGGQPGTTYMFEPGRDPERLEEARELTFAAETRVHEGKQRGRDRVVAS